MSPSRAPRPCSRPLCPELVIGGGYCQAHRRDKELERGTADSRGYNVKWRRIRAQYIKSLGANPGCENCGRTEEEAGPLEVDHIDGRGPTGDNSWRNLQLLCKSCHSTKTAAQTRGALHG